MPVTEQTLDFSIPGQRLTHLLDCVGFLQGRGRTKFLHELLIANTKYDFSQLKYSTVRSWFHQHAPTMRKVNAVIDILNEHYVFNEDAEQIAVWWKVGGYNPYFSSVQNIPSEELDFMITALIAEEAKALNVAIKVSELLLVKEKVIKICQDFGNPNSKECPDQYKKLLIRGILYSPK